MRLAALTPGPSPARAGEGSYRSGVGILTAMFLGACVWVGPAVAQQAGGTPKPAIVIESHEHCIAPPEVMRREHPEMLMHQRERTVHLGERGARVSLNACIRCHASRETGSVIGTDKAFCQSCHSYAAVRIDCFDCHQPSVQPALSSLAGAPVR